VNVQKMSVCEGEAPLAAGADAVQTLMLLETLQHLHGQLHDSV